MLDGTAPDVEPVETDESSDDETDRIDASDDCRMWSGSGRTFDLVALATFEDEVQRGMPEEDRDRVGE